MPDTQIPAPNTAATALPLIDLGPYFAGEPGALESTAAQLRHICETVGFL